MKKIILFAGFLSLFGLIVFAAACGSGAKPTGDNPIQGKVIKSGSVNNLTVTLSNDAGRLKTGEQEFFVAFTDASGKAVDAGAASLNFYMPAMGSMSPMNDAATLTTTGTPGVYRAKAKISMAGEWQAQIAFEGAGGKGKTSIPVTAQ